MPDETKPMTIDLEQGTITLKKGNENISYSLKDPADMESLAKKAQEGWYFKTEAEVELGQLRNTVKNWDAALAAARESDEAMSELVGRLETSIGRSLTKAEKQEIKDDTQPEKLLYDDDENSKLTRVLTKLNARIDGLEKENQRLLKLTEKVEQEASIKQIDAEAAALAKKYNGEHRSSTRPK